jgi:hypothetical protein
MNEPGNHAISLGVIVILGVELPAAADRALAMLARRPLSGALGRPMVCTTAMLIRAVLLWRGGLATRGGSL